VQTLPHPTHDRYLTRWFLAGAGLAGLSFVLMLWGDNSPAGDWRTWLGAIGFSAGILLPWLGFRHGDRTLCPRCETPLCRAYGDSTFVCLACEVTWKTGWSGGG
jgi:hypothetical protein